MQIELTQEQLTNLGAFLNRVDLKGAEVPAFIDVINALNGGGINAQDLPEQKD